MNINLSYSLIIAKIKEITLPTFRNINYEQNKIRKTTQKSLYQMF